MKILNLKLKNFKGIKSLSVDANGQDVNVYGDNATGKTTIFDAFTWLFFDKDSENKKDFNIKTLTSDGQAIHGLEHEVSALIKIVGLGPVELKKILTEKWTKQKGSAEKVFTGHTTEYYIDGVPKKKGEYEDFINSIADDSIFKLLTSPLFFNESLKWQDRRKLLIEVCGDISDKYIIDNDNMLSELAEILTNRSIEDHKKVITASMKKLNEDIQKIPTRIDECNRNKPQINGITEDECTSKLLRINKDIEEQKNKMLEIKNGVDLTKRQKELIEVQSDLIKAKNKFAEKYEQEIKEQQAKYRAEINTLELLEIEEQRLKKDIGIFTKDVEVLENKLSKCREDFRAENATIFETTIDDKCPTCKQSLPASEIEKARVAALERFNTTKANKLNEIKTYGNAINKDLLEIKALLKTKTSNLEIAKSQISIQKEKVEKEKPTDIPTFEDTDQYKDYQAKLKGLQLELDNIKISTTAGEDEIKTIICTLENSIAEYVIAIKKFDDVRRADKRISELMEEQRELSKKYEEIEKQMYLIELFTKAKVNMLDEKINNKFKLAKFKLFNTLINGGLDECCETTYNGVPYSDLNNAMKINIGLDIINTLCEFYNKSLPIFIDNAESVTKVYPINTQVFKLIVSEKDKTLRIESEEN